MSNAFLVGWLFLILSWIIPAFVKDKMTKNLIGLVLSALSTGVFIGALIEQYFK